jgi:hypothetical protein
MSVLETITFLSLCKGLHVAALCVGFGAAILCDWIVLQRCVFRPVNFRTIELVHLLANATAIGLTLLWITGIVLTAIKLGANPQTLGNEKLLGKIVIVTLLTLNGALIHMVILPMLPKTNGRRLFDGLSPWRRLVSTFSAAVSTASWCTAIVLGIAPELNFKVGIVDVLMLYVAAICVCWIGIMAMAGLGLVASGQKKPHSQSGGRSGVQVAVRRILLIVGC